jgi:hypothetical protein
MGSKATLQASMEKVIRTENGTEDGLNIQYIFGMGIYDANKVKLDESLEVKFLRLLSREKLMSAHAHIPRDLASSPLALFGPPNDAYYEIVSVGPKMGTGTFYRAESEPRFPPCFFPKVTGAFWSAIDPSVNATWEKMLYYDAVVFYLEPKSPNYVSQMNELFANDSETYDKWMKEVVEIYRVAVSPAGDMNYFKAYAKDAADFDILADAIRDIENLIHSERWYRANKDNLVWDGESGMCLILPSS